MTPEWHHRAACRSSRRGRIDPELFFPLGTEPDREAKAKQVCARCPVTQDCLEEALDNNLYDGVWGGLNPDERRKLKRRVRTKALAEVPPEERPVADEKYCRVCEQTKPADEYGKDIRAKDGLNPYCRVCTNEAAARRRREAKQAVA